MRKYRNGKASGEPNRDWKYSPEYLAYRQQRGGESLKVSQCDVDLDGSRDSVISKWRNPAAKKMQDCGPPFLFWPPTGISTMREPGVSSQPTAIQTLASPQGDQAPTGIGVLVDMDEDGIYPPDDFDDNDPNIGAIEQLDTADEGPSAISIVTSPTSADSAPTGIDLKIDMDEDGVYSDTDLDDLDSAVGGLAEDQYLLVHRGLPHRWNNYINTFNKAQAEAANTFGDLSMYGIYEKQPDIPVYAYDAPMGASGTILGYAPWWKRVRITDWQGNNQQLETNPNPPYIGPYAETDNNYSGIDHYWINYKLTSSDPAILNLHRGVTHNGNAHFQSSAYDGTHSISGWPNQFNYLRLELIGFDYNDDWSQSADGGSWTGNQNSGYRGTRELVHPAHHDNLHINTKYWIGQQDRDSHTQSGVKNISCYHVNLYSHDGLNGMPARNTAPYILPLPELSP